MMAVTTINVNPHKGQKEVHQHQARFKVLASGRRWGKTRLGVNECFDVAARGGRAWWVAPSYKMSEVGWRPVRRIGAQVGASIRRADRQIMLPNGGEVSIRSADNPDSLRGEALDFVVLDECAFIKPDAWNEALRPALSDRLGNALFISTPKGRNWFWHLFTKGQDPEDSQYQSWQFKTADNPHIEPAEIEAARESLPEMVFLQEYEAEFIEDAGTVFRRVMDAATSTERKKENGQYVFGVDWGKHNDFTVISVFDSNAREQVYMDRFNQIDYQVQLGRLKALYEQYTPFSIIAESNAMGEPLIEQLQRDGLPVLPFKTTNQSKAQAIESLALAFESNDIKILPDPVQLNELQAYELERLPSGLIRYNAPDGMHDDTVIALALAWQAVAEGDFILFGG